jgi:hypothetical protein
MAPNDIRNVRSGYGFVRSRYSKLQKTLTFKKIYIHRSSLFCSFFHSRTCGVVYRPFRNYILPVRRIFVATGQCTDTF